MSEVRTRRPPPAFQVIEVVERLDLNPHMTRLTLEGDVFESWELPDPAASFRLVVPWSSEEPLELPTWNGNEFLLGDGTRPALRTFTPLRLQGKRLDVDVVRHQGGAVSGWADNARLGAQAAVSGVGAGYQFDPATSTMLILGDETAIPAITTILAALPDQVPADVIIETRSAEAQQPLPDNEQISIRWIRRAGRPGEQLAGKVTQRADFEETLRVWAAGEAASMQAIRKHLKASGIERQHTHVRGYWKVPRAATAS